ncbi:hypothetical protein [Paludisphaera mucosa]|uniref:Uncharacterized protein n=1 Tax=Paludisphaera mucosa TaxID=3030827 RepID=A0ABT6FKG1_9BACT|nr:hypothetical protein [Paludisphaera mucosa]MDG3008073.1 hypothetical protein [Paludisphaera mucosa]
MSRSKDLLHRLIPAWARNAPSKTPRQVRRLRPELDGLEGRLVLSRFGSLAGQAMSSRVAMFQRAGGGQTGGGAGGAVFAGHHGGGGGGGSVARDSQLAADLKTYQAAATSLLRGSAVTDAQRVALHDAFGAVQTAGVTYDKAALATVADNVLTALADTDAATTPESYRADFVAAFTGSGADGALTTDELALVNTAFDAFVTVADNLDADSTELSALTTARAAITADYTRLGITGAAPTSLELILGGPGGGGPRSFC